VSSNLPTIAQAIEDRHCSIIFWRTSTDVIIAPESYYAYGQTQGRHIRLDALDTISLCGDNDVCPRCYNDWDWSVGDGLARCKTRGCNTSTETTGRSNPSLPMTEEQIVFDEFEGDLHDEIADDIENGTIHDKFLSILNTDPLEQYYTGEHPASTHAHDIHPSVKPEDEIDVVLGLYREKTHHPLNSPAPPNVNNLSTIGEVMSEPRAIDEQEGPADETLYNSQEGPAQEGPADEQEGPADEGQTNPTHGGNKNE